MARGLSAPSPPHKAESTKDELRKYELHSKLVPAALRVPWSSSECPVSLFSYSITLVPLPPDRDYRPFGLFLRNRLPAEAEAMEVDLHLAKRRIVRAGFVPLGTVAFDVDEIEAAERFQEMWLKILLDRKEFFSDHVALGKGGVDRTDSSTFYLLLPLVGSSGGGGMGVDWETVRKCLSSPVFQGPAAPEVRESARADVELQLANGPVAVDDVVGSLVWNTRNNAFFFVVGIGGESGDQKNQKFRSQLDQPLLNVKRLFSLHNLLQNTLRDTTGKTEVRSKEEHFQFLPPELCSLKILGFTKDIGSSLSLLPSMMHHLQNVLVAIELKTRLSVSFTEGSQITANRVFEALTTEQCLECSSLERLELLGDAFLKYTVARHEFLLYEALEEGKLSERRQNIVSNLRLYELAVGKQLQGYIHDEEFIVSQFFALGRPCTIICSDDIEYSLHFTKEGSKTEESNIKCIKSHHRLQRKTIADVVEALVGAFLVDVGFTAAIAFLHWIGIDVSFESCDAYRILESSKRNLSLIDSIDISRLEQSLHYSFEHKGVLLEALVHPSYNKHAGGSYQRLEFLGDSALEYLITSYIYSVYPELDPGKLSILRSVAVNNSAFAQIAVRLDLHLHIIKNSNSLTEAVSKYERFVCMPESEKDFLEEPQCPKVLADIVESCFGAILLDSGFDLDCIWRIFLTLLAPILSFDCIQINPIKELRELCPSCDFKKFPVEGGGSYKVEVEVNINDNHWSVSAVNPNSNTAARMASQKALHQLKDLGYRSKRKSLEEILRSTKREEAKLIGFDERPFREDGTMPQPVQLQYMDPQIEQLPRKDPSQSLLAGMCSLNMKYPCEEELSAKLRLLHICAVNNLCPPSFVSCEESSSKKKMFKFMVIVTIEAMTTTTILESFSDPQVDEVVAIEQAANGMIWYLEKTGYICSKMQSY